TGAARPAVSPTLDFYIESFGIFIAVDADILEFEPAVTVRKQRLVIRGPNPPAASAAIFGTDHTFLRHEPGSHLGTPPFQFEEILEYMGIGFMQLVCSLHR